MRRSWSLAVLTALATASPGAAQVSGTVRNSLSLSPIGGAVVSVQATTLRDTTAADGTFSLPGASGSNLTIVGAAVGFYNRAVTVTSPATGVVIGLTAVPADDHHAYSFTSPSTCGMCHPDQLSQWTNSPMHLAGLNAWVYDLYDGSGSAGGSGGFVYRRDSRFAATNPESECSSCHQPEPWIEAPFSGLEDLDSLSAGALRGVHCDICHKIAHVDETRTNFPGLFPGVVTVTRPTPSSGPVMYGVLGDTDYASSLMRASLQPQLEAAVCAACHQDKNDPDQDGDFEEPNGVISEPTYLEWLSSDYGDRASPRYATCSDCHMPAYGATTFCVVDPVVRDPATIRHHRIEGTTPAYLDNSASLALDAHGAGGNIEVEVRVTNTGVGHHLPTGVTIRNMILLVEAWRGDDGPRFPDLGTQTVDALGGVGDPALGYYAGLPGKLYAKVPQDSAGAHPVFFTEATGLHWDNRIPALATDTTRYAFAVTPGNGVVHVRARLIYRRSFRALVDAKGWMQDGHGHPLEDLAPPHFGHLMEQADWVSGATDVAASPGATAGPALTIEPNPCAGEVGRIRFSLASAADVRIRILDVRGREVARIGAGRRDRGTSEVEWRLPRAGKDVLPSGLYVCVLEADGVRAAARRLVLIR